MPDMREDASVAAPRVNLRALPWREFDRPEEILRWKALALWAAQPNPFYEDWYLLPSLRALDPRGRVQMLALEVDGQLAGLMPLARSTSYYGYRLPHLRNWVHDNCFLGLPLVAQGMERIFWREVLQYCDGNARLGLFLHLMQMSGEGPLHDALSAVLSEQARPAATVMREERAMLASDMAPQAYLEASLSTKKRKELRRQFRRLGELGDLQVERLADCTAIEGWIGDFLKLEEAGWKGQAGSSLANDQANTMLFSDALEGAAGNNQLERLSLVLDGRRIAMLATLVCKSGAFSYKTAFDETYARFSPGVLLQCENLEIMEREDVHFVDSCAAENHNMIDHIWRERRQITRHSIGIGGTARRAFFKALAKRETGQDVSRDVGESLT